MGYIIIYTVDSLLDGLPPSREICLGAFGGCRSTYMTETFILVDDTSIP